MTTLAVLRPRRAGWAAPLALLVALAAGPAPAAAQGGTTALSPCRVPGIELEVRCGVLRRPLDPAQAAGPAIDVHFAVLPALARSKKPDPVVFFAGGPGQGAIELAPTLARTLSRLNNRRDIVLLDQRGTGRSGALSCDGESPVLPLAEQLDPARQEQRLIRCLTAMRQQPKGDLRQYTTAIAAQDVEAVRRALGAERINVVGGSYGTRMALEVMRQYPGSVRRAVLDGVAPPDMVLPASFSVDNQAALEAVFSACDSAPACRERMPNLRQQWQSLLGSLPRTVPVVHPVTGETETVVMTRGVVLSLLRSALYVPSLASALPAAMAQASTTSRFEPLIGLALSLGGPRRTGALAQGMHFAVICAEDLPRLAASREGVGADFGSDFADLYRRVCAHVPAGSVPEAFYAVPQTPVTTLLLSGGADPVTPPRHGERVARQLGPQARHVVVANAGHGVMGVPCMRDLIHRFIDADDPAVALAAPAECAAQVPRPPAFLPPRMAASGASR